MSGLRKFVATELCALIRYTIFSPGMIIDPLLSLAISMNSQKGIFAILLGSGVSRSAGIPTGWEVITDLAFRVARAGGHRCKKSAAIGWFVQKYGEPPDYSRMLEALASTPAERQQLLRSYFEPTAEEAEQGIKSPTLAHHAIAELVEKGHVRVILTTNFDRLTEEAIESKGIIPTVIASPEAVDGALPLVHSQCTVIKLHGDYLDSRLKNTETELASYDPRFDRLLDRVLDEYGLIICGWSAQWDIALRAAFERRPSRRFSFYWVSRGETSDEAKRLITLCQAQEIRSTGADSFFPDLAEKVQALSDLEESDTLPPQVAAATVKRYLAEARYQIRLADFVAEAITHSAESISSQNFEMAQPFDEAEFILRMKIYESATETLRHAIIPLCYWGKAIHHALAVKVLELNADYSLLNQPYIEPWRQMRLYPSVLLLYAGGIAALSADNYEMFSRLLLTPKYYDHNGVQPLLVHSYPGGALRADLKQFLPGYENRYTPASDYLFDLLRPLLEAYLPQMYRYADCFDRFEYIMALAAADLREKTLTVTTVKFWGPIGRFAWRPTETPVDITEIIENEIAKFGSDWPPLKSGLFDGSLDRVNLVRSGFNEVLTRFRVGNGI